MFTTNFSPDLTELASWNHQYPRTIFMVPRFGREMFSIVRITKANPPIIKRLFSISWDKQTDGTFIIEKVADDSDIPDIIKGLETCTGKTGKVIYEEALKKKKVEDFNV